MRATGIATTSPLWLRRKVRKLIEEADILNRETRALADQRQTRYRELEHAQREEKKLLRELDDVSRTTRLQRMHPERDQADFTKLENAHQAAAERVEMIRQEDAQLQAAIAERSALRGQARQALQSILSAVPDAGTIEDQVMGEA